MTCSICVGDDCRPLGTPELVNAFFSSAAANCEPDGWGSRLVVLNNELAGGEVNADRLAQALDELSTLRSEWSALPPSAVVWDYDQREARPPWGDDISDDIGTLADYFVTSEGESMIEVFEATFRKGEVGGQPVVLEGFDLMAAAADESMHSDVYLNCDNSIFQVGSSALFGAFFNTVAGNLEGDGWGTRFPVVMLELYDGELNWQNAQRGREELAVIAGELADLPPGYVVWDADDPAAMPPWGNQISEDIASLAQYFRTPSGTDLLVVLDAALSDAVEGKSNVTVQVGFLPD